MAANAALEGYVEDDYIVDLGDKLAHWGWAQPSPHSNNRPR